MSKARMMLLGDMLRQQYGTVDVAMKDPRCASASRLFVRAAMYPDDPASQGVLADPQLEGNQVLRQLCDDFGIPVV